LCAIAERTSDYKQVVFSAFDPVEGRGRELTKLEVDPNVNYAWDLSPDSARIAIIKSSEPRIHVLSLNGGAVQQVDIKGWNSADGLDWAADAKGVLISSHAQASLALLHVDLQGNARVLWRQSSRPLSLKTVGVPSPDGRHLTILGFSGSSNFWMIETS
jgi:hypothetical protein